MIRKIIFSLFSCLIAWQFMSSPALSSPDYPDRPVTVLTMVQRHAQIDLLARQLSREMSNKMGQPFNVINRPGGCHGSVMARELKEADADGYTLGVSATPAFTCAPHFLNVEYTLEDFVYISKLGLNQSGIVTRPDQPYDTLREAFDWARDQDRHLTYIYQGVDDRDVMQRIARQEGVELSIMPSTGGPSVIAAVTGGHADIGHLGAILFEPVQEGRLKLLAATTPERLTELPGVPTLQEQGWDEYVQMFVALAAPKGVPEDRMKKLEETVLEIVQDKTFQDFLTDELFMVPVQYGREHAWKYMEKSHGYFEKMAE